MASHQPRSGNDPASAPPSPGFDALRRRHRTNALRVLCLDLARHAGATYPTAAMAMADVAEVLWGSYLRHNPRNPSWADRDRFVLSDGHMSPLLYGLLHLTGYDLPRAALPRFGKSESVAPFLPALGATPGVEVMAGPAGQGLANAVGMALAQHHLAARFNRAGHPLIDHFTYALLGQGCLMEGVSHEACSLAGTLGIGKLIALHGAMGASAETPSSALLSEHTSMRFKAYGWHVLENVDGHDPEAIRDALEDTRGIIDRPSLICFRVAASTADTPASEVLYERIRQDLGWPHASMEMPEALYVLWDARENGTAMEADWERRLAAYSRAFPELATEFRRRMGGKLPTTWGETADGFIADTAATQTSMATRQASYNALNRYASVLPELLGGSADLTPATKTRWKGSTAMRREQPGGNHVNYGARELAMTAVMTGIARHGGFIPFGGTFLMFCEYARYAMQLAVANRAGSIFVFTHDSIGLGEDGPTHQPIEQVTLLRLIPGMVVWRPCDALECAVAWRDAIERRDGPTCLVFTRQTVELPSRDPDTTAAVYRGGYVMRDCPGQPELILIATGSEVPLATLAAEALTKRGHRARAVSIPCTQVFESQDSAYRKSVLPSSVRARLVLEAGITPLWWQYAGPGGKILGIDRFGESAPQEVLFDHFGFTVEAIVAAAEALLKGSSS